MNPSFPVLVSGMRYFSRYLSLRHLVEALHSLVFDARRCNPICARITGVFDVGSPSELFAQNVISMPLQVL